jgi:hypothetical protein
MLEEIKPKSTSEIPFKDLEAFSDGGKYSVIKFVSTHPEYLVKEGRTKWKDETSPGMHPLNDHERIIQDTQAIEKNFREYFPRTQLVEGKNKEGENIIYIIQEKVTGKYLDELEYSETPTEQIGIFFDKVIDNYIKHLFYAPGEDEPRSFYPDLNARNFVLGHTAKDPSKKLYYIDSYPIGGGTPSFVVMQAIPSLISRWPAEWRGFIEEYARKFEKKVSDYISQNKDKIPQQGKDSLYRT